MAARGGKQIISWNDFNEALDRIILGLKRGSLVPSENERKVLAFHEAGHAVASVSQPDHSRLRKVTIMPRGNAGGFAAYLGKEQMITTVEELRQRLVAVFAGRVAEKKLTGTISSGAGNDLKQATDLAKRMVFDLGMGEEEFVAWGSDSGPVFLGGEISRRKDFSEETARELEGQVSKILRAGYEQTEEVINDNWLAVEAVANALLKRETLDGAMIEEAYKRAQEDGASAESITSWLINESEEAEERLAEENANQRESIAPEPKRRNEPERPSAPIEPRPAEG